MPRLIINADDLGSTPQRSHGILLAREQGVVTSVSLVANGNDSERAARHAGERDIPTGLHLVLTRGTPITRGDGIESLLTTDGFFLEHDALQRAIEEGMVEPTHVEREVRSQIEWFLEHRGQPTHMSSHDHVHVIGFLAHIIAPILDRYGIGSVRIPAEPRTPFGYEIDDRRQTFIEKLSMTASHARTVYAGYGIASTEYFRGLAYEGNATMRTMRHTLARLPEGTVEWMVHPGSANPQGESFESDPQRQTELQILINPDTAAALKEREVQLCSFVDPF